MLEKLYENIGVKIKSWAKWIFIVEAVSAIIGGFIMVGNDDAEMGLIMVIAGPVVAWVSSWLLYAFGQLVDDTNALRCQMAPAKKDEPKPVAANKDVPQEVVINSDVEYKAGNCEFCGTASEQLIHCKIVDDLGVRYRTICKECITKHRATPVK